VKVSTNKVTAAGLIIALGIIYGDIGTSPLYVMNAIINGKVITEKLILGGLSCIIWTLTLQTTVKYVILTLRADNRGEGGIFSLFALVRRRKKWLVIPAMIGGAALIADGMITSISVTSVVRAFARSCIKGYRRSDNRLYCNRHPYCIFLPAAIWHRIYRAAFWPYHDYLVPYAGYTRRNAPV
jgi:hypothetical protein